MNGTLSIETPSSISATAVIGIMRSTPRRDFSNGIRSGSAETVTLAPQPFLARQQIEQIGYDRRERLHRRREELFFTTQSLGAVESLDFRQEIQT